jgi:hypothetical protein
MSQRAQIGTAIVNILTAWVWTALVVGSVHADSFCVYTSPGLLPHQRSRFYDVSVNGRESVVYMSVPPSGDGRREGGDFDRADRRSFSHTTFSFSGQVEVLVRKKQGTFADVKLRPTHQLNRAFKVLEENPQAGWVRILIMRPNVKISVEFIDEHWRRGRDIPRDALLLFADPPERDDVYPPPERNGAGVHVVKAGAKVDVPAGTETILFSAGLHDLSYWIVPEGVQRVHLDGGAYVMGGIDARRTDHFKVTGRGVISGEKFIWRAEQGTLTPVKSRPWATSVKVLDNGENYFVEGVTLTNASHFVCNVPGSPGTLKNIKIIGSWRWNNDGIGVSRDSHVTDCFISAFDDAFKLYHSGGHVSNCVVWQMNNGAVFQLGWGGKSPQNVTVENIDVIHTEFTGTNQNWGLIALARHRGRGSIGNYLFQDIRMEGPVARIIGLHLHESPHQKIRHMRIVNLSVDRILKPAEYPFDAETGGIKSAGVQDGRINVVGGDIEGLRFENFTIDNVKINQENYRQVGRFTIVGSPDITFE